MRKLNGIVPAACDSAPGREIGGAAELFKLKSRLEKRMKHRLLTTIIYKVQYNHIHYTDTTIKSKQNSRFSKNMTDRHTHSVDAARQSV